MNDATLELFDKVNNVEFTSFVEDDIPVFTVKESSVEEWNSKAKMQNTKMFIQINKRLPRSYKEVLMWINSLAETNDQRESHSTGIE